MFVNDSSETLKLSILSCSGAKIFTRYVNADIVITVQDALIKLQVSTVSILVWDCKVSIAICIKVVCTNTQAVGTVTGLTSDWVGA